MGLHEFKVLPFGLTGGPSYFQRIMDQVLCGLEYLKRQFIDYILVFSPVLELHRQDLKQVFRRLREYKLTLRGIKCVIGKQSVTYLGHTFSDKGMAPQTNKVESGPLRQIMGPGEDLIWGSIQDLFYAAGWAPELGPREFVPSPPTL